MVPAALFPAAAAANSAERPLLTPAVMSWVHLAVAECSASLVVSLAGAVGAVRHSPMASGCAVDAGSKPLAPAQALQPVHVAVTDQCVALVRLSIMVYVAPV